MGIIIIIKLFLCTFIILGCGYYQKISFFSLFGGCWIGIIIGIIGSLIAAMRRPTESGRSLIDPRMRDEEIIRNLQRGERIALPNLVILVGFLCIIVSIAWRLLRLIIRF